MITLRTLLLAAIVLAVPLSLSACGKKTSLEFPPGSDYPRQYPSAGEKQKATDSQQETGNENNGGARSPLGFPLEYPNRSSY